MRVCGKALVEHVLGPSEYVLDADARSLYAHGVGRARRALLDIHRRLGDHLALEASALPHRHRRHIGLRVQAWRVATQLTVQQAALGVAWRTRHKRLAAAAASSSSSSSLRY